jgi:plastocyanin
MPRLFHRAAVVVLTLALGVGALSLPGRAQSAPATWKVLIGADSPDHAIQGQDYYPRTITINAGDSVTWTKGAILEHTVTFLSGAQPPQLFLPQPDKRLLLNPAVAFPRGGATYDGTGYANSGVLPGMDKSFAVTFTKPGRYTYVCLLHRGMTGTVVVEPAGSKRTMTQAAYDKAASAQWAAALAAGERLRASSTVASAQSASGTVYTAPILSDPAARVSLFRFTPAPLVVKAGSTVRWVMRDVFEIHTVTFQGAGDVPAFLAPEPQKQGPPKIFLDPKAVAPFGGARQTGDAFYNSGIMVAAGGPPGPVAYSLTFSKPGTYTYWCVVHIPEGMTGTIVVR